MTQNIYGTSLPFPQTLANSKVVNDSAVMVWEQMGLNTAQIMYGLALMTFESADLPRKTNGKSTDTIRGLGQFKVPTWNATAAKFDSIYHPVPGTSEYVNSHVPKLNNAYYNYFASASTSTQGTNAQSGESNDFKAGAYDPNGLVAQLEVIGQGIIDEWKRAETPNDQNKAAELVALGPKDANLFNPNAPGNSALLATVARAYLEHHEGASWVNEIPRTAARLNDPKRPDFASVTKQIVAAFSQELRYIGGDPNAPASTLLSGDPWELAGAYGSAAEGGSVVISHDIPSLFPTLDNFLSQTADGLKTYSASYDHATGVDQYTYSTYATGPGAVVSGNTTFDFNVDAGSGKETLSDRSTVTYTFTDSPSGGYSSIETRDDASGNFVTQTSTVAHSLNGVSTLVSATTDGATVLSAQIAVGHTATQSQVQGDYDSSGRLIDVLVGSAHTPMVVHLPDSVNSAAQLAQEYGVPLTDTDYLSELALPDSVQTVTTSLDSQGQLSLTSPTDTSGVAVSVDPGFQADVIQDNGKTLRWSFNAQGSITSEDVVDRDGKNVTSVLFDSSGAYAGNSVTTASADGSAATTVAYDTSGIETGYSVKTDYTAGTVITINGVPTTYADGVSISTQYGVPGTDGTSAILGFSVNTTHPNTDGSFTTTETNYVPASTGAPGSAQLTGSTITATTANGATSIDYGAEGEVTGSRTLTENADGSASLANYDGSGDLISTGTVSMDLQGNASLNTYNSSNQLTDSKSLSASGSLTDVAYADGAAAGTSITTQSAEGETISKQESSMGAVVGDSWILADGTHGTDTTDGDGSSIGVSHFADSTSSSSTNNGAGSIITTNNDSNGITTGTTETTVSGSGTISQFVSVGGVSGTTATFSNDGTTEATAEVGEIAIGAALDIGDGFSRLNRGSDGATTSDLFDGAGVFIGTSVTPAAVNGAITTQYDPAGAETGYTQHSTAANGTITTTNYSVSGGTATETGYSVSDQASDGMVTTQTYIADPSGNGTFDQNGSATVSISAQGLVTKDEFAANSQLTDYVTERIDSQGDTVVAKYDSSGYLVQRTTAFTTGVVENQLFQTANGVVTTTVQINGSYEQVTDDGTGDVLTKEFSAGGVALSDIWTQSDGSHGQDTFNSDGSSSGQVTNADGSYSTYAAQSNGDYQARDFDAFNHLLDESDEMNDGAGNSVTLDFDGSGNLVGQTWVAANGNSNDASIDATYTNSLTGLLVQSAADSSLAGGASGTILLGWGNGDTLTAGAGATLLDGVGSAEMLQGGSGDDTLVAIGANTTLIGGSGNQTFEISDVTDVIEANANATSNKAISSVSYTLPTSVDTLTLSGGADLTARGNTDASNLIVGNSGNDVLYAGSGHDALVAGTGNDTLVAGSGVDTLVGGTGDSLLEGHGGDTYRINSGFGNTTLRTTGGSATLNFGSGISASQFTGAIALDSSGQSELTLSNSTDTITIDGVLENAVSQFDFSGGSPLTLSQLLGQIGLQSADLTSASGEIVVDTSAAAALSGIVGTETIIGSGAHDTITAGVGNQVLYGLGSGDVLIANEGNDTLYGGSGSDSLIGGTETTVMYGGGGVDSYSFTEGGLAEVYASSARGVEVLNLPSGMSLTDFTASEDSNGNLVLEDSASDTRVVVEGYYVTGSNAAQKLWIVQDDTSSPSILSTWLSGQVVSGTGGGATSGGEDAYRAAIDQLREQYGANLPSLLDQIGYAGGRLSDPSRTINPADQYYNYHFSGTSEVSETVQNGQLSIGSSEQDATTYSSTGGSTTRQVAVPVYGSVTIPGGTVFLPVSGNDDWRNADSDASAAVTEQGPVTTAPVYNSAHDLIGLDVTTPDQVLQRQVGVEYVTETISSGHQTTSETQGFTAYNIQGDDGNDVISALPNFSGTVVTGNGNNVVNLGGQYDGLPAFYEGSIPGAFVELGDGNNTVSGTGGEDVIAAGNGFNSIEGSLGSTYYVPMTGDSTDIINSSYVEYGGDSTVAPPPNTLVLGSSSNLQFKLFATGQYATSNFGQTSETLQITSGDSTVLIPIVLPASWQSAPYSPVLTGIDRIDFLNGGGISIAQALAAAGPVQSIASYDPAVSVQSPSNVVAGTTVSASNWFSATDGSGSPITWYQITNVTQNGGHFVLNGVSEPTTQTFEVSQDQLAHLRYFAGDGTDQFTVSAFDGLVWGNTTSFDIVPVADTGIFQASGPNQEVDGSNSNSPTIEGGYAGDTLVGASGQDRFLYNAGSGAETLSETLVPGETVSGNYFNTLQFGSGIAESSIVAQITSSGQLKLNIGTGGDSVTLEGFDPLDPLHSAPVQQVNFADGSEIPITLLLADSVSSPENGTIAGPDGGTISYTIDPQAVQPYIAQLTNADGHVVETLAVNSDGSTVQQIWTTAADGTAILTEVDTDTGISTTTTVTDFDAQQRPITKDVTYPWGETDNTAYTYGTNGTSVQTAVDLIGGSTTTTVTTVNALGQSTEVDTSNPDGSTDDSSFAYNADGSTVQTDIYTSAGGSATTTSVIHIDVAGNWTSDNVTNPDGSTSDYSYTYNNGGSSATTEVNTSSTGAVTTTVYQNNALGQSTEVDVTNPDGSTQDTAYSYNSDGSDTQTEVEISADSSTMTTIQSDVLYGHTLAANSYTTQTNGSYTDSWSGVDGSSGAFWWNSTTAEYHETWQGAHGTSWTDDYQFAAGGAPNIPGASYTETFSSSDGSEGTRQYDAASGVTTLTWDSATTGTLSGTINDADFVGLQDASHWSNTQPDLTFFNSATNPAFSSFLSGH